MFKVGIVGAGFIGRKRAENATAHLDTQVALVYDVQEEVAAENGGQVATSWQELVAADLDIVTVATTHDALAEISTAALSAGKHVLCEKPMGRNPVEARLAR